MCRLISIMMLAAFAVMAAGCFGATETDEIAYILALGVDKSEEQGKFDVTYQLAIPRAMSGDGIKPGESSLAITFTADSLAEARNLLNSVAARSPSLSHIKVIIVGEALARQGLNDIFSTIKRFREFRGSMFLIVVHDDTAQNFIKKNKLKMDVVPSRYYETTMSSAGDTSYYIQTNLHDFYTRLKSNSAAPIAMLGGINTNESKHDFIAARRTPPNTSSQFEAGYISRVVTGEEATPIEFLGVAVFHDDKMVGTLASQETRMVAILSNKMRRGYFTVEDPLVPDKKVTVILRTGEKPKLSAVLNRGQAKLTADVLLEGEITTLSSGIGYEMDGYRQLLEEQISQTIRRQMLDMLYKTQVMKADVIGFGYLARSSFRTYDEYMELDWDDVYSRADIDVKVTTKIRRTGLLWKTMPINTNE